MADRERRLQHSPLADDDEHLTPASLERLRSLERDYRSSRVSMCVILCGRVCFRRTRGKGGQVQEEDCLLFKVCIYVCGWILYLFSSPNDHHLSYFSYPCNSF